MLISRAFLWILLAVPAWSQAAGGDGSQMRLYMPGWDINDIYNRLTGALSAPHKKQQRRKKVVNPGAIDDYYNNYWENYYYNNPPYVEYVPRPWPRPPPPRPRPTRRPRPTTTTSIPQTSTTTASTSTTSSTTPSTTTSSTTTTSTTPVPITIPPVTTDPPDTTPTPTPNTTNQPVIKFVVTDYAEDYNLPDIAVKPEQQLSIKTPPKPVTSLCHHHPKLCEKPNESHFMELTDGNGHPLILIAPAKATKRKRLSTYQATRRPLSQRIRKKDNKRIYKNFSKTKGRFSNTNVLQRSRNIY